MTKRAKKSPIQLSKGQIAAQMEQNALFQKRMKFIKEQFWPLLCETSESIEDAVMFLSGFNTALMQAFLSQMKDKKFSELKLDEMMADDKYKEIVVLFNEMDVFTAKEYIEGMKNEIGVFKADEDKKRKLSELKPTWVDELK